MHTHKKRYGFSLMEMAIVFGIVGMVLGGVWVYASVASQTAKVEESIESINIVLENTRNVYAGVINQADGKSEIYGGVSIVVPFLVSSGAMPTGLINSNTTACQGVSGQYASNAWGSSGDACGSLRLCAWQLGIGAGGSGPTNECLAVILPTVGSQFIGLEFADLSYSACVGLATHVTPTSPAVGLADVYINGTSMSLLQTGVLPGTVANVQTYCKTFSPAIIDFVYHLRAPPS